MSHERKLVNRELLALLVAGMFPVIAPAQAQPGRGELGAAADSGPLLLAQATSISALDAIAAAAAPPPEQGEYSGPLLLAQANSLSAPDPVATAAPRPGRGESALISVAPPQAPQNDPAPVPAAALIVAQSTPPAAERPIAVGTGFKFWRIPPIRWGGNLAMDLRGVSAQGQPRQVQFVESANLRAGSFIWQPWFAQVRGEMTLLATQQRQGEGSQSGSAAATSGIKSTSLTGGAQLALFPVSRFPFTASFSQTDNRANGELTYNQYTSRRYDLTQSYVPPQGGSNYRLSYNHSDVNSAAFGADTAKALNAGMNWSSGFNTLSINGNGYTNTRGNSGDASSLNAVSATHSYRPRPTFAIESLANFSSNQYHLVNAGLPTDSRSHFLQFNSFATWRPEENSPLLVSGGARLFQNSASANGAAADTRAISANVAATYALNRNTRLSGAGTVTQTSTGGVGVGGGGVFTNQTVSINHNADVIKFGEYAYTWTTGSNLGNQSGGESGSRNFGMRIGHRVSRNITLGEGSALFISVSQDYSMLRDTLLSKSQSLLHNANASWSKRLGEAATTVFTLNAADSRTTGTAEQHLQFVNLQASGQMQFSRWASASANLTFQATRQSVVPVFSTATSRTPADSFVTSAGGSLSYQNTRAFGVLRLRYFALLDLNQYQGRSRLEGDINAPLERVNRAFEQRLDYDIGRLQTRLSLRVAETEGRTNGIIFFRVLRQFGSF